MSGRWDQSSVPHRGWRCIEVDDLEEAIAVCEMCGQQEIRYVHTMEHPECSYVLNVGCHCAERMEEDYVGPRARDEALRNRAARRARWCNRAWKVTRKGGLMVTADGYVCVITQYGKGWRGSFTREGETKWLRGELTHPTANAAKLALFDRLWPRRRKV